MVVHRPLGLLALEVDHAQRGVHGGGDERAAVGLEEQLGHPIGVQLERGVCLHPGKLLVPHLDPRAGGHVGAAPEVVELVALNVSAVVPEEEHVVVRQPHPLGAHGHVLQVVDAGEGLEAVWVAAGAPGVVEGDRAVHAAHRQRLVWHVRHVRDPPRAVAHLLLGHEGVRLPHDQRAVAAGGDVRAEGGHVHHALYHVQVGDPGRVGAPIQQARLLFFGLCRLGMLRRLLRDVDFPFLSGRRALLCSR
mmetsp:Transcript_22262/g.48928  ORF Transcript_22262/g.48928 Transcript_22262/m.48928 type:complete len:248 (-) Transcript_22262:852-1595(-)